MTGKASISVWTLFSLSYAKPLLLLALKYLKYAGGKTDLKMYCALDFDKRDITLSLEQLQIIGLQIYTGECLQDLWKSENSEDIPVQQAILLKKWSFQKLCLKACLSLNTLLQCKNYNMLTRVLFRIKTTDNFILFSLYKIKTYPFWFFCSAIWSEAQGEKKKLKISQWYPKLYKKTFKIFFILLSWLIKSLVLENVVFQDIPNYIIRLRIIYKR